MSTRATSNIPSNVTVVVTKGGHTNDEHAKSNSAMAFPVKASNGNAIEIWSDGAVWDTVANKFVTIDSLIRNG
jgi:hypothetical protein